MSAKRHVVWEWMDPAGHMKTQLVWDSAAGTVEEEIKLERIVTYADGEPTRDRIYLPRAVVREIWSLTHER